MSGAKNACADADSLVDDDDLQAAVQEQLDLSLDDLRITDTTPDDVDDLSNVQRADKDHIDGMVEQILDG